MSNVIANPVSVISINDNRPPRPWTWAAAVAKGLVSVSPDIPLERRAVAFNVRNQVVIVLARAFAALTPRTSLEDIPFMAEACADQIAQIFVKTVWSFEANDPNVRAEFARYITVNLRDAVRLIKRME